MSRVLKDEESSRSRGGNYWSMSKDLWQEGILPRVGRLEKASVTGVERARGREQRWNEAHEERMGQET